jgi:prepilin-type N-terminal cleavage/methylation domain-containing protein
MPISSTGTNLRRGFTLIELMVVLAIMVIVSGIAVISMQPILSDARMRSGCRMVASMLNYARSHAVTTNSPARVLFVEGKSIEIDVYSDSSSKSQATSSSASGTGERELTPLTTSSSHCVLPDGVTITRISKPGGIGDENWLEFGGLGQAEQAVIELTTDHGQKRFVAVDQITGRCRIRNEEEQQHYEDIAAQEALQ